MPSSRSAPHSFERPFGPMVVLIALIGSACALLAASTMLPTLMPSTPSIPSGALTITLRTGDSQAQAVAQTGFPERPPAPAQATAPKIDEAAGPTEAPANTVRATRQAQSIRERQHDAPTLPSTQGLPRRSTDAAKISEDAEPANAAKPERPTEATEANSAAKPIQTTAASGPSTPAAKPVTANTDHPGHLRNRPTNRNVVEPAPREIPKPAVGSAGPKEKQATPTIPSVSTAPTTETYAGDAEASIAVVPARSEAPDIAQPVTPPGVLRGGSEVESGARANTRMAFVQTLATHLHGYQIYPRRARRRGITGETLLSFSIDSRGRLIEQRIAQSSGHPMLDRAALGALQRAQPLPAPPPEFGTSPFKFSVPFTYRLNSATPPANSP